MPKLDPSDNNTLTTAPAPLPTTSATTGSGAGGFGGNAGLSSSFGTPSATGSFGGSTTGSFGAGAGGFGGTGSFGGSTTGSFGTGAGMGQPGMGVPANTAANLQSTGGAMQEGGTAAIEVNSGFSNFINQRWRPLMAVIYMITCFTDFVLFPVLWSVMQALFHGTVTSQWAPLTLQGAGLYHIAMGAVLGLAAYGRSQEKIAGKA